MTLFGPYYNETQVQNNMKTERFYYYLRKNSVKK